MNELEIFNEFDRKIDQCIELIKETHYDEARYLFNEDIYKNYIDKYVKPEKGFMNEIKILMIGMDEYFNNEGAKVAKLYTTEDDFIFNIKNEDEYIELKKKIKLSSTT